MNEAPLKVLMMPDYRSDNPYQSLLADGLRSQGAEVVFPRGYRRVLPFYRAVQDNSATVLHLHWLTPYLKGEMWLMRFFYSLKMLIDLWLTRFKGVKIIWTIHNDLAHDCPFPKLELWLRKKLLKVADEIIVHNHATVEQLQLLDVTVIPHGHYRDVYQSSIPQSIARKQLNLPLDGYLYLNLGMIRPYKGIENLLQVWQANQTKFQAHNLLIAGKFLDSAYEKHIGALISKAEQVILQANFIPSDQMHLYFSAADVVVLPFTNILTSGSLILAMSYGKPVIAPSQGAIQEILQEADSLLYDPSDRQGLAKALKTSTQIDLQELSKQVRLASDRLDWDKIAQQTVQLYQTRKINY
ncbi:glycosyltransferase [Pleurocapsa sp. PCC 7319]|uniref:glycosyltransferase n=1 Tax=Pleurocapsa sp. PCC 7319 TaxID=118161 RepID=UPI00034BE6ED|nr:glycosyltransferase [Pleurocapsa sp. PCC 7319]